MTRRGWGETIALVAAWAAAIVIIHPRGNFPLDDDWDFAIATWNFAREGHYHFTHFTAMSLRALVPWGALWTRAFGESFEVLRASTLTLSAVLIVVVNRFLRTLPLATAPRVITTLAFAFNPIFLWSSCTYMTEVPFVLASMIAMICFWLGLSRDAIRWIAAGCVAAAISWFIRQTGVTLLFTPLALLLLLRERISSRWKGQAAIIGAALALFGALLLFRRDWLAGAPEEFANHFKMWHESSFREEQQRAVFYHYTVYNVQHAALFFLPLTAPIAFLLRRRRPWPEYLMLVLAVLFTFVWVHDIVATGHPMPYFSSTFCCDMMPGNTLVDWGLGPQTLTDTWAMNKPYSLHLTAAGRLALTYSSAAAAALLLWAGFLALVRAAPDPVRHLFLLLAIGTAVCGTGALFGSGLYFDRYAFDSAWSVGFAAPFLVPWERRAARMLAIVLLAAVAVFGIFSVNEYFAWNRARWAAFDTLRVRGIPIASIDAGSEPFNFYEVSPLDQRGRRKLLWHKPRPYMLTFNPIPGYRVIGRVPFEGWMGWHGGAVLIEVRTQNAE